MYDVAKCVHGFEDWTPSFRFCQLEEKKTKLSVNDASLSVFIKQTNERLLTDQLIVYFQEAFLKALKTLLDKRARSRSDIIYFDERITN